MSVRVPEDRVDAVLDRVQAELDLPPHCTLIGLIAIIESPAPGGRTRITTREVGRGELARGITNQMLAAFDSVELTQEEHPNVH